MPFSKLINAAKGVWATLTQGWQEGTIDSPAALRDFISTRAALVAQKAAVDYCRGKTGLFSYALFEEKEFQDALTVCRWETFAATLADTLIITEGFLRPATSALGGVDISGRVGNALAELYPEILASYPLPIHRTVKGWADAKAAFAIRFAATRAQPPRPPVDVANHSARRLFETLPIHTNMREFDEEIVHGAVRFRLVAVQQELQRRARPAELVAALAAGKTDP